MKNIKTRCYGHKGITKKTKKNAEHEKHMKCMQEELDLSRGIEGGVEEDFNRSM